ncbi:MAG: ComF family protein, partial [Candidatus Thioglobus sp.]|nr:ComF family protein [Candidatus Thioglobus sp.]
IAKKSDILIDQKSVKRIKATRALSTLDLQERQSEIKNAFSAQAMNYQKVLLVDDVMTTGSSLNELAKTVLKAGVGSCDVLTLARA